MGLSCPCGGGAVMVTTKMALVGIGEDEGAN